jgi:CRISPR-associated protein Csx17
LSAESKRFAWTGRDLSDRLVHVLQRRLQLAIAAESDRNPFEGACCLHAGDATLFIEGSVDDSLVEDLIFVFTCLDWSDFKQLPTQPNEVLPTYAVLKFLFLAGHLNIDGEKMHIRSDTRIISQLAAGHIENATKLATDRLRIAGLRPLDVPYYGGVDARRLAAALLIPVRISRDFFSVLHKQEEAHA